MAYNPILNSEIQVGDPITQSLMQKVKDNDDFFNGLLGQFNTLDIINGSFEQDSDVDGTPDNWTWAAHPGGTKSITTGIEGDNAFRVTVPTGASNGGGTLDSDYFPVPEYALGGHRVLSWMLKSSSATIGIKVSIRAYTSGKSFVSSYDIYSNSTTNPTAWTPYFAVLRTNALPTTTRYIRVRLESGTVGPGVSGTVDWDAVSMNRPLPGAWLENSNWVTTPVTTTSNAYSTLTTTGFAPPGAAAVRIGGECSFIVSGYIQMKIADPNIGSFAQVTHTGSSTTSNEMRGYKLQPAGSGDSEQIWDFTIRVAADYSASYALNLQAKNDDNTTTVTLTQPGYNFLTIMVAVDW